MQITLMTKDPIMKLRCKCCGKKADGSIQVMEGMNNSPNKMVRYYLPNQHNRAHIISGESPGEIIELALCPKCMRTVEDNFRATIQYLQVEAGCAAIEPKKK
ncbi:hypothetical protein C3Y94_026170 [Rhizobium ruizarguesonis]|uniref:hypothetical protein n=1 Tax=Rhizobium ruizarguesonis TaxID=2081791 RepID=UPI001639CC4B|nr:hypothetical protein [Rhizobium ruizarguesonis]MBC2806642.1 hypothetical protein [Rhizobium ruizarguesonis]